MGDQGDTARTSAGTARLRVFVNYRRTDSAGHAGRLYDALAARFGDDAVFMDVDAIEPGTDFAEVIDQAMDACDVVLAVIGPYWLLDATGRRRIDASDDFVRMELESALQRQVRIIPLLVNGAEMPRPSELPESLVKLAGRQGLRLRDDRWHADLARLMTSLEMLEREHELRRAGEFDAATQQRAQREELVREQADQARREPGWAGSDRPGPQDGGVISEHGLPRMGSPHWIGAGWSPLGPESIGVRFAGVVAIIGACLVLGSLPGRRLADLGNQARVGYWLPVAVAAAVTIALNAYALRSSRPGGFVVAGALAFALLGVTLPLAWHEGMSAAFPSAARFWLGAGGSALAALGAAYASWSLLPEMSEASPSRPADSSRGRWFVVAILGAAVVITSLFVLPEWTWDLGAKTTSQNWGHGIHRYPSGVIFITVMVIALGLSGVVTGRTRRLVLALLLACLLFGESLTLIYTPPAPVWGPGRWLRILAALVCATALAQAAEASEQPKRHAAVRSATRNAP